MSNGRNIDVDRDPGIQWWHTIQQALIHRETIRLRIAVVVAGVGINGPIPPMVDRIPCGSRLVIHFDENSPHMDLGRCTGFFLLEINYVPGCVPIQEESA